MNISQRLRTCAKHTGLDAVIELLQEAADEIDRLSASAALPTMRPGDSHMESLIEAAIQGHASTRDAMRWLVHQLVPHPSMATQAEVTDAVIDKIAPQLDPVGEEHPAEWDIWKDSERICAELRAILPLCPERVPMTPLTDAQMEAGRDQIFSINNPYCPCDRKTFAKVAQWVERHHKIGITAQAKKEGA